MNINFKRGFTLIELLVVIAIIGILASVVLASLNTARAKGNEAKIASQLSGARAAAEIYYSNNNGYSTVNDACTTASTIFTDTTSGMSQYTTGSNYPSGAAIACDASATAYAVRVTWDSAGTTKYWCVDSTGVSVVATTTQMLIAGDSNCDANDT